MIINELCTKNSILCDLYHIVYSGLQTPIYNFAGLGKIVQDEGFRIVVPGIGSGSWDADKTPLRIRLLKSEYFISSFEGCVLPGVINPIIFLCWVFINLRDSAKSLSFDTTTAQSYKLRQASFRRCKARLTSEPFSSVLIILANFIFFPKRFLFIGYAKGLKTLWVKNSFSETVKNRQRR